MRLTIESVDDGRVIVDMQTTDGPSDAFLVAAALMRDVRDYGSFLSVDDAGNEHCRIVFGEYVIRHETLMARFCDHPLAQR